MAQTKKNQQKLIYVILFIVVFLALSVFLAIQKIAYLAANPTKEKVCPPLYPTSIDLTAERNTLIVNEFKTILPWIQQGGSINDASCLDETTVHGIIAVTKEDDVKKALLYASENNLKVSIAGVKHSMGGQAFARNAIVLDMTKFNTISLNENKKTITVQSGATWHEIQKVIHPKYAVKAMQSTDIFTVGGSISVNAHGMDHQVGALSNTIRSIRVMLSDGTIQQVSKTENPELFHLVIGGYGLFGIILDAEIDITENSIYETKRTVIGYKDFPEIFAKEIANNKNIGLLYGHLSTAPQSFLSEMILYVYEDTGINNAEVKPLAEVSNVPLRRFVLNWSKEGNLQKQIKWFAEKYIEPRIETCTVNRNQAMKEGESCLVSRNDPMHDSVPYLKNSLKNDTDILHEYFIPRGKFVQYIDGMRKILQENNANVLNASVRVVHKEHNFLSYATGDMYSIVLYINQTTDQQGNDRMKKLTGELIDLTNEHEGKFFLPYQLHYTEKQLLKSYPSIPAFFAAKKNYDPNELLTNTLYEKYKNLSEE